MKPTRVGAQRLASLTRVGIAYIAGMACLLATPAAQAFEQAFSAPGFVLSVPKLPAIVLAAPQPSADGREQVHEGHDATLQVDVHVAPAAGPAGAASTRACASPFLRELVQRPGMPDRDAIYRAPFDADTFLVLYIREQAGQRLLHAHVLSATAGTHCIDAHFSRAYRGDDDVEAWRLSFSGARVLPQHH
jgi:hypothetical protein